jgi:hypothetical protein
MPDYDWRAEVGEDTARALEQAKVPQACQCIALELLYPSHMKGVAQLAACACPSHLSSCGLA